MNRMIREKDWNDSAMNRSAELYDNESSLVPASCRMNQPADPMISRLLNNFVLCPLFDSVRTGFNRWMLTEAAGSEMMGMLMGKERIFWLPLEIGS